MRDDFAVFIMSHGRADRVITLESLKRANYTGKWYIIIDDQDTDEAEYYRLYGDRVIKFSKEEMAKRVDSMDLDKDRRCILYARNFCFEAAKELGLTYFLELDDDYIKFRFRYDNEGKLSGKDMHNFDKVVDIMIDFLEATCAKSVALAQGGDFIGGTSSNVWKKKLARKAMNSFFCKTDRPFEFIGTFNEDVNAYTLLGSRGELFFTIAGMALDQIDTQQNKGGMTDIYLKFGTYIKSIYTVICMPSAVKVQILNTTHKRIHHRIDWDRCIPQILSEAYRHEE